MKLFMVCYRYWTLTISAIAFCLFFHLVPCSIGAQQIIVLPHNGYFSTLVAPQGAARYQRQFYLITSDEMEQSGLVNNDPINSIGFTIGAAQSDTSSGGFIVYLENTMDTQSRIDMMYTEVISPSNSITFTGLVPGTYEVEVISTCPSSTSVDTARASFNNIALTDCNPPTSLNATVIGPSSVTLNWTYPNSAGIASFVVEYRESGNTTWTSTTAPVNSKIISGLNPEQTYQWRAKTICSGENSGFSLSSFTTLPQDMCNEPTVLTSGMITDSSATLSWTAAQNASYYNLRYRRVGTTSWISTLAFSNSINIVGLNEGTSYEWEVRSNCALGKGAYVSGSTFSTIGAPLTCYAPGSIYADSLTNSSMVLSWNSTGASSYTIRYRLKNSIDWTNAINGMTLVHDDSITIPKTIGSYDVPFISGSPFAYSGNGVYVAYEYIYRGQCEVHVNLVTDSLGAQTTFTLKDANTNELFLSGGPYLNDKIITIDETICLPEGTDVKFKVTDSGGDGICCSKGNGSFEVTVNGNSVSSGGTFTNSVVTNFTVPETLPSQNISLSTNANTTLKGSIGQDSLNLIVSLGAISQDSLLSKLISKNFRPETRFGSPNMIDSVEVVAVYALGYHALSYVDTARISATIKNHSALTADYEVILTVKDTATGTIRHGPETLNVTIDGNMSALVSFNSWVPSIAGTDSIIISVPQKGSENVTNNNSNFYLQVVNNSTAAYDDGSGALTNTGFSTGSGLILIRQRMDGCGSVNAAKIYLDFSAKNKEIYAVIMDGTGTLIDSSDMFTPDSTEVNNYHTFYFPETPFFDSSDYYIGLAQMANGDYNPVGVQWETPYIRDSAYYRADIDGSNLINHPSPGRLMISAKLVPGRELAVINRDSITHVNGNLSLCLGETDTLFVGSKSIRYANRVGTLSSQFSSLNYSGLQALGAPDVDPDDGFSANQWVGSTADGQREFIDLEFPNPGKINYIDIFETLNSGAVDSVFVKDAGGTFLPVYSRVLTSALGGTLANIKHISLEATTAFDVSVIRITLASDSISGFNGIDAVGIGLESDTSTFSNYEWSTGSSDQFLKITMAGTYSVKVTDSNGCEWRDSIEVITPLQTPPDISIVGSAVHDTTFCMGGSIVLKSNRVGGNIWRTGELASDIIATTDSIIVDTAAMYFLDFDDNTDCGLLRSDTITVSIDPLPIPTISGALGICPGGTTTLDAGAGYASYLWSNNSMSQTIHVSIIDNFFVTVSDGNGCTGISAGVGTFVATPPTPNIIGVLSFCINDSTLLDAGPYSNYLWSTGETTQTIYVDTADTFFVTVTEAGGCSGTTNATTTNYPSPIPSISGIPGFCPGDSTVLTAGGGYSTYLWSTGSSAQSITVNTAGMYTVNVTDNNGCLGSNSKTVTEFVPPSPVIEGSLSLCGGSSVQIMASGEKLISYIWSTGQTTSAIFVDSADTYSVTVTDINGCTGDTSATVTELGTIPMSPGPITGPTFLSGDSVLFQYSIDPVMNASFYFWTVPDGLTIVGRDDSTVVIVAMNSEVNGSITVAAANGCGLSPSGNPTSINFQLPSDGDCNIVENIIDNTPIPTGIYLGNTISSTGSVSDYGFVLFRPESSVNLNVNFNVSLGANFEVQLDRCDE